MSGLMFRVSQGHDLATEELFGSLGLKLPLGELRLGVLDTAHGKVETPAFMPVATKGTVKLLGPGDLEELNVQAAITNAFLLSLRPGTELLNDVGGIHGFMDWQGCFFADSGGFQMIRQGFLKNIDDSGVSFRSPFSGDLCKVSPEDVIDINVSLGSDVAMMLDHVPPEGCSEELAVESLERTLRWGKEGLAYFREGQETGKIARGQQFFAITQGGIFPRLRERCARELAGQDFDGYGIGGLCIGEEKKDMFAMLKLSNELLPREKMRYFMGVGKPEDVIRSVALGVDIFDSVFPTRNARHRSFFTKKGTRNIRNVCFARDSSPLEEDCECPTCQRHTRAYLHHLCRSEEFVWMRHLSVHNLFFMMRLMREIREAIREERFPELAKEYGVC